VVLPVNLEEYEALAKATLSQAAFDYIISGADDEKTLGRNRTAFDRYLLRPRALAATGIPSLVTTVLDTSVSTPVLLAPTALQRLVNAEGELATARAAGRAGTLMVASTLSTQSLEAIASAATGPLWFQLYVYRDRGLTSDLVRRAESAGYRALCLTVDTPRLGRRERDIRTNFSLPEGLRLANFAEPERADLPEGGGSSLANYIAGQFDPTLGWQDVDWLGSLSSLPVVLIGIMSARDARLAVEHGAAAVVVSNHGGRQLDAGQGTIEVLEEVVEAVAGRCEVYVDGGIRRGTDVVKALALGARAVLIGRPYLWGLAVDGEDGVCRVLELLNEELRMALMFCGCRDVNVPRETVVDA
jgi:isopentenyl diphosphate isomerase/L-lactate dehydrogenase-like FMN-dependent dehydrogenase